MHRQQMERSSKGVMSSDYEVGEIVNIFASVENVAALDGLYNIMLLFDGYDTQGRIYTFFPRERIITKDFPWPPGWPVLRAKPLVT